MNLLSFKHCKSFNFLMFYRYLIFITIIRPLDKIEANIVLFVNEFIFWALSFMLIYYNIQSRWTDTIETIYLRTITSNNIITAFVVFGTFANLIFIVAFIIKSWMAWAKKCRSQKTQVSYQINSDSEGIFYSLILLN